MLMGIFSGEYILKIIRGNLPNRVHRSQDIFSNLATEKQNIGSFYSINLQSPINI